MVRVGLAFAGEEDEAEGEGVMEARKRGQSIIVRARVLRRKGRYVRRV
jgi:hypothetical protein